VIVSCRCMLQASYGASLQTPPTDLPHIGSSGVEVTIPSAFVTFATFNRLERLLEKSNTTTSGYRTLSLAMLPEIGGWEWYS